MRTTIDAAGRVVVPKALRDRLGLVGGTEVDIDEHDGVIEIRAAPVPIEIVDTPDGPVARALSSVDRIDDAVVTETLERVRR